MNNDGPSNDSGEGLSNDGDVEGPSNEGFDNGVEREGRLNDEDVEGPLNDGFDNRVEREGLSNDEDEGPSNDGFKVDELMNDKMNSSRSDHGEADEQMDHNLENEVSCCCCIKIMLIIL